MKATRLTAQLALGLILNQVGLMAVPAVLPTLMTEWHIGASAAGWLGGVFFLGYALGAGLVAFVADRVDGRLLVAGGALLGAAASLAFAAAADGPAAASALRLLAGLGLAAVHMPGLKLLAERTAGPAQARASAIYASAYAVGSGGSFLVAGALAAAFGWRWAFWAGGVAPLLALPTLLGLGAPALPAAVPPQGSVHPAPERRLRAVLADRRARLWLLCYAGNTWEVFGLRTWFVAFLAWSVARGGGATPFGLDPALLSGLSALVAVPASIAVAEASVRWGRRRAIMATAGTSVAVTLVLAAAADGPTALLVVLLFALSVTAYGDTGSIAGGAVAAADPRRRGTALALFALGGFVSGFLRPVAVGQVLAAAGGTAAPLAWRLAFPAMGLGSLAVLLLLAGTRDGGGAGPLALGRPAVAQSPPDDEEAKTGRDRQ